RQQGLQKLRTNEPELAVALFDDALELSKDAETSELIGINKAFALISLGEDGEEVQKLPQIVLGRRNSRHVLLACYNLLFKYRLEGRYDRARFYGKIALECPNDDQSWRLAILTELGSVELFDSQFEDAIEYYRQAFDLLEHDPLQQSFVRHNIGYCTLISGDPAAGVEAIRDALAIMEANGLEGFIAEPHLDLALGYLEMERYELAQHHGRLGLEKAREERQIRNAHYLLGEIAHYRGDTQTADIHFEHLCRFYPDFPQLKNLLYAIDLRGVINWKL
ncbi:MAG: hypothetical protein KY432_04590, partial [Acidobacteria bacterium]|nr:hypothetical protein [Acidobacteriota bacterium]